MANILQKAAEFLRLRSSFTQRPSGVSPTLLGQYPIYPQYNQEQYIRAYLENAVVYTIVHMMAGKWGFIPRYLYKVEKPGQDTETKKQRAAAIRSYRQAIKSKDPNLSNIKLKNLHYKAYQDDVVEGDPLSKLMAQPNPYQGQDSYYAAIYTYKKLTGNAFVWLDRGPYDDVEGPARYDLPVLNMFVLPSQYMTIRVNRDVMFGQILGYRLYNSGSPEYLAKEDVIHWKDPNPAFDSYNFTQLYGLSPLQPGLKLLTQDYAETDAAVAMFQNGGARGVLYNESFNNLSKEQVSAADSAINTKINNRQMKSAVVQLPGKWGYEYIGQSAVDMELIDAQDTTFTRICNLFGCNPQLFQTESTFNNVEQARKDLITNTILPDCASFRDEENRVLLRAFGYKQSDYCIDIDVTDLAELSDDMDKLTTRTINNWTLTPNEKRDELGFDPLEDSNMDKIFAPTTLTLLDDIAMPTADPSGFDPATDPGNDPNGNGQPLPDIPKGYSRQGHKKGLPPSEVDEIWGQACTPSKNGKSLH